MQNFLCKFIEVYPKTLNESRSSDMGRGKSFGYHGSWAGWIVVTVVILLFGWPKVILASILPVPSDYKADETAGLFWTIWAGGFALLVVPWVLYMLVRKRDSVPILLWLGGFIASVNEAMLDHLGHLWWPTNLPGPVQTAYYDLNIPLLVPLVYPFWVSMMGYIAYRMMVREVTIKKLFLVWLAMCVADVVLEIPGTATQVYMYYGESPFKIFGFPLWWAWINGTGFPHGRLPDVAGGSAPARMGQSGHPACAGHRILWLVRHNLLAKLHGAELDNASHLHASAVALFARAVPTRCLDRCHRRSKRFSIEVEGRDDGVLIVFLKLNSLHLFWNQRSQ